MITCELKEDTCLIRTPSGLTETVEKGSKFNVLKKTMLFIFIKGDAGSFIVSTLCYNKCFNWDIEEKA